MAELVLTELAIGPMTILRYRIIEFLHQRLFAPNSEVAFTHMKIGLKFVVLEFYPLMEFGRVVTVEPQELLFAHERTDHAVAWPGNHVTYALDVFLTVMAVHTKVDQGVDGLNTFPPPL